MITKIIKRDGREVPFNIEKIAKAIFKSQQSIGIGDYGTAFELACDVANQLDGKNSDGYIPTVEEVQDAVVSVLSKNGHTLLSKVYQEYRDERTKIRDMSTTLMKTYESLTFQSSKENNLKRENANINGDTSMGVMLRYGSEGAKQFNELFVLKPKISKAHIDGDIHIHDLDFMTLTTTCCQIDLEKLFKDGFSTGHGYLREPNDIQSYAALACIAIQSDQNDQHGGQSVPMFDYAMAKGVKKSYKKIFRANLEKHIDFCGVSNPKDKAESLIDILTKKGIEPSLGNEKKVRDCIAEILKNDKAYSTVTDTTKFADDVVSYTHKEIEKATHQAMEALIANLNTMHSRAGAQIPFSSINYGTDISPEGRLVMKCLLQCTDEGLGRGETPIFPIQIFKVKEGVNYNPSDPNYDLFKMACKVSAKRLFPNFSFLDAPFNAQFYKEGNPHTEIAYMGCRTRVIANSYDKDNEIVTGRGNLSFTSVNLPRIAIEAKGNTEWFFDELGRKCDLVVEQLLDRFKIQSERLVRNYPFLMGQGIWLGSDKLNSDDKVGEVLKHGTLTLGFIGLAECLKMLIGVHHGESDEAQSLGLEIVGFMRKKADEATKKYGLNFSLIGTPAEGLSQRFVNIDKKKYGIITGVTDREYYTNSFHVPVYYNISAVDKIKREAPYHTLTNGGHITYIELDGDPLKNIAAYESIVRCMKESGIGYGAINHPVDHDPVCGYTGIIDNICPQCGRTENDGKPKFERIRRITGYLVGTLDNFNNGKRAEVRDRVKHGVGEVEEL